MKKHKHNWKETTLSRDAYGDTTSFACDCGMWKVETKPVVNYVDITSYRVHGKTYDTNGKEVDEKHEEVGSCWFS